MKPQPTTAITASKLTKTSLLVCFTALLSACPDSSGDNKNDAIPQANFNGPTANIAGRWDVSDRVDARNCGEGQYTDDYTLRFEQQGNNFTVYTNDGSVIRGIIRGNVINWQGSYYEDGGNVSTDVEIIVDGTRAGGNSTWNWSDGVESCGGTTRTSATCISGNCLSQGNYGEEG